MPVENYPLAILFLTCRNSRRGWETAKERRRWEGVSCSRAGFAWLNNDREKDRTFHLKEYHHAKFAILSFPYLPSPSLSFPLSQKKFCRAYFFSTHIPRFPSPPSLRIHLNNERKRKTSNDKERKPDYFADNFRDVPLDCDCTRLLENLDNYYI